MSAATRPRALTTRPRSRRRSARGRPALRTASCGAKSPGSGTPAKRSLHAEPKTCGAPLPSSRLPPSAFLLLLLWQTNVMWGAGNCHCHRRRLRLPRPPSLTVEEGDAFICRAAGRPPGSRSAARCAQRAPAPGRLRRAPAPGAPRPLPGAGGRARGGAGGEVEVGDICVVQGSQRSSIC